MKPLKVYGGNLDGTHRVIMATTSCTAFCRATCMSRDMGCETGNEIERGVALNEPGVIFITKNDYVHPYRSLGPSPIRWEAVRAYVEGIKAKEDRRTPA